MSKLNRKSKAGISLVEVIIAVALLGVLVVTAVTALNLTQTAIMKSNAAEKSASISQGAVDSLLAAIGECETIATLDEIKAACASAITGTFVDSLDFDDTSGGIQYNIASIQTTVGSANKSTQGYFVTVCAYYQNSSATYSGTAYPLGGLS